MSLTISQQILKHTQQTAEDTRAIRSMLESRWADSETPTERHDNLDQHVLELPPFDGLAAFAEQATQEQGGTVAEQAEVVPEMAEQPEQQEEPASEPEAASKAEQLINRFRKNLGG